MDIKEQATEMERNYSWKRKINNNSFISIIFQQHMETFQFKIVPPPTLQMSKFWYLVLGVKTENSGHKATKYELYLIIFSSFTHHSLSNTS
uniref:Uncharacterized protein n=1 Tax=Octopus bimaculoides TaxID=37653 RepID=A0A0L8I6V3_OCTBM